MYKLVDIFLSNIIIFIIVVIVYYLYKGITFLKNQEKEMVKVFNDKINEYVTNRIIEVKDNADSILNEYQREDAVSTEINRLLLIISKGISGSINDKVITCNTINKFKLGKNVDLERYPSLGKLNGVSVFTTEIIEDISTGMGMARKQYNLAAFRYNEKASSFPFSYIVKLLKMPISYAIFETKNEVKYDDVFEVFEEKEVINSISSMNIGDNKIDIDDKKVDNINKDSGLIQSDEVKIEHTSNTFKPKILGNDDEE